MQDPTREASSCFNLTCTRRVVVAPASSGPPVRCIIGPLEGLRKPRQGRRGFLRSKFRPRDLVGRGLTSGSRPSGWCWSEKEKKTSAVSGRKNCEYLVGQKL